MIISHRHKFIFIKTRKTAGTSVEKALGVICGPDDILTPDHLHDSELDELMPQARNWQGRFNPLRELSYARRPIDAARTMRDFLKRPKFYNHMRASSVMARISRHQWKTYYKFCFERNPWDKMISFFHWNYRGRKEEMPEFQDYVMDRGDQTMDQHYGLDWERYTLHDRVIVDRVCDFSNLRSELDKALLAAGVPEDDVAKVELPRLKSNIRSSGRKVSYTPETAAKVAEVFQNEIEAFNYKLPAELVEA